MGAAVVDFGKGNSWEAWFVKWGNNFSRERTRRTLREEMISHLRFQIFQISKYGKRWRRFCISFIGLERGTNWSLIPKALVPLFYSER
jgi:hypothetical protein